MYALIFWIKSHTRSVVEKSIIPTSSKVDYKVGDTVTLPVGKKWYLAKILKFSALVCRDQNKRETHKNESTTRRSSRLPSITSNSHQQDDNSEHKRKSRKELQQHCTTQASPKGYASRASSREGPRYRQDSISPEPADEILQEEVSQKNFQDLKTIASTDIVRRELRLRNTFQSFLENDLEASYSEDQISRGLGDAIRREKMQTKEVPGSRVETVDCVAKKMYALVFWIESCTTSIVDTSSFPPSANENDEIDLLDDKENTMHRAKIIKISENKRWLQTIDVDVEGNLMVRQMRTRSKNKRPTSKKQKKKTNVQRNLEAGQLEEDLFEPGDGTSDEKSGKAGKSTEALSTSLRCNGKRTKVVIDTLVSTACSIPKGSGCCVPAVRDPSFPEDDEKSSNSVVELGSAGRTPKDMLKKISTPSNATTPVIQPPTAGQATEKPAKMIQKDALKGKKKRKVDIDSQSSSDTETDDSSQVQRTHPRVELETAGRTPKDVLKISPPSLNSTAPVIKPSTSGQSTQKPAKMNKKDATKQKKRKVDIDNQSASNTEIDDPKGLKDSSLPQKNTSSIPGVTLENLAQRLRPMFAEILEKMDQQKPSISSICPRVTRSSSSASSGSDSPTPGTSEPPKMRTSHSGHTKVELQPGSGVYVDCIELKTNIDRFNKSPKEMVRRLLVYLVGAENLKNMTARGMTTKPGKNGNPKKNGRAAVPKKILDAIKYYVDRKGSPMDWPYFIRVVNLKCDTLRNPKQAPENHGKATEDSDDEDND